MSLSRHLSHAQPEHPRPHRFAVAATTAVDPPTRDDAAPDGEAGPVEERRARTHSAHHRAADLPLRCLIVDDNLRFLQTARFLLEREGLTIVGVASTGADALARATAECPDVVLADVMLGTESGFELARRLVENDPDGRASVILISTHAEADFAELIEASPAAGFLAKADLSARAIRRIHAHRR